MKKFLLCMLTLIVMLISLSLVSCGDDDKSIPIIPKEEKTDFTIELVTSRQAVDLGLPSGTLWANMNIGANSNAAIGCYYKWGETSEFTINDYKYVEIKEYGTDDYTYIGNDISGTQYDVARVLWGQNWKLPSIEHFIELVQCCKYGDYTLMGQKGYVFVGNNGNKIFLPFGGHRWYNRYTKTLENNDSDGPYYWTSSLHEDPQYKNAQAFTWHYGKYSMTRPFGCSVRAIQNSL